MKSIFQKKQIESILFSFISILCFLIIWALCVEFTQMKRVMPNPAAVIHAFITAITSKIGEHVLPIHVFYSLKRVAIGYLLACVIGIPLGILMGSFKTIEAFTRPIYELFRPIPGLAWIPLAILWFGIDESPKYYIIFISAVMSIILNTYAGAKQVDSVLIGAARMLGANDLQIFVNITLPASVPQIFAGLQVGLSSSWMAVIAAEMIRSSEGSGWIIITGMESGNTLQILVGMVSIGVVGLLLASLLRLIEGGLCAWNPKNN